MILLSFPRKTRSQCIYQKDFQNGKRYQKIFYSHQDSTCHQGSSTYHLIVPQCNVVGEMIDDQITQQRKVERKYLLEVIKLLRYLVRQGIPLQGLDNNDSLTQILYLIWTKDDNTTKHLQEQMGRW